MTFSRGGPGGYTPPTPYSRPLVKTYLWSDLVSKLKLRICFEQIIQNLFLLANSYHLVEIVFNRWGIRWCLASSILMNVWPNFNYILLPIEEWYLSRFCWLSSQSLVECSPLRHLWSQEEWREWKERMVRVRIKRSVETYLILVIQYEFYTKLGFRLFANKLIFIYKEEILQKELLST